MIQTNKVKYFKSIYVAANHWCCITFRTQAAPSALQARRKSDCHRQPVGCCSSGFADDEEMLLHRALETAQQITQSVDVTVSMDYTRSYAQNLETLTANIKALITTGVMASILRILLS